MPDKIGIGAEGTEGRRYVVLAVGAGEDHHADAHCHAGHPTSACERGALPRLWGLGH